MASSTGEGRGDGWPSPRCGVKIALEVYRTASYLMQPRSSDCPLQPSRSSTEQGLAPRAMRPRTRRAQQPPSDKVLGVIFNIFICLYEALRQP